MKELIAKRYIKALSQSLKQKELEESLQILEKLANVCRINKFQEIMDSPYISVEQKIEFILQVILENKSNSKFANFIRILAEHKRLDLFQELYAELSSYLASLNKEYVAKLMVSDAYDETVLKEIESKFSQKLGVNLVLEQQITQKNGIKLVVEDLGVEISFSQERFIQDLKNHIFRAF